MKRILLLMAMAIIAFNVNGQNLKPYILAGYTTGDVNTVQSEVKQKLKSNGFEVLGTYHPMGSNSRVVIAVSNSNLTSAVKSVGGFTGFAAVLRVALTKENGKVMISYTNPEYWGRAYFTKKWNVVSSNYSKLASTFKTALSGYQGDTFTQFGSEDGLSTSKLKKYHYMMGMPYFEDNIELKKFGSFDEAITSIDNNLSSGVSGVKKVYSKKIGNMKLYGLALTGSEGEKLFMAKIDVSSPKHTAFLPYELLVKGNKAYMLHGRFRIALAFPDLSMGQFMKIVSTPGYIEDKFEEVCK